MGLLQRRRFLFDDDTHDGVWPCIRSTDDHTSETEGTQTTGSRRADEA